MSVIDRFRLQRAVQSYDWWLDLQGVSGRRRRELRQELRANLTEAAQDVGAQRAVASLGSTRRMAAEAVPDQPDRPRWRLGIQAAVTALVVTVVCEFFAGLAWADGVMATDPDSKVEGAIPLFPGSSVAYEPVGTGFSVTLQVGWLCLVVALIVLVIAARAWRALSPRSSRHETSPPSVS
jgi:hypothetical protein